MTTKELLCARHPLYIINWQFRCWQELVYSITWFHVLYLHATFGAEWRLDGVVRANINTLLVGIRRYYLLSIAYYIDNPDSAVYSSRLSLLTNNISTLCARQCECLGILSGVLSLPHATGIQKKNPHNLLWYLQHARLIIIVVWRLRDLNRRPNLGCRIGTTHLPTESQRWLGGL